MWPFWRTADHAGGFAAEHAADEVCGFDGLVQIDAGVEAHAVEHVEQVFRGHVTGRARYGATPWSGTHTPFGCLPRCQNTSIGMPPRGYQ